MRRINDIRKLSEDELDLGIEIGHGSWHDEYKDSAWIYVGGFPFDLTEGDLLQIFSQFASYKSTYFLFWIFYFQLSRYGEITEMNMPRDKETGKQRGFCFLKYEDQRSTILAVDNFNGITVW